MHPTLGLMVAGSAAQELPLIDLDSTVFVQFVIFLITAFFLSRFLFKPFLAMRAERARGIEGAREEAQRMEEEARASVADYETRLAQARSKAEKERSTLRAESAERERQISDSARQEAHKALEESRASIERDTAQARKALEPRARDMARVIARKILGREVA